MNISEEVRKRVQLFFRPPGLQYEWNGSAWHRVDACRRAVRLANGLLQGENLDCAAWGLPESEEEAVRVVYPVVLLALDLSRGGRKRLPERLTKLAGGEQDLAAEIARYLNGQDKALWEQWARFHPWPFFAKGNWVGWFVEVETEFLAAVAEAVTFYANRWRPGFTACRECLILFHGGEFLCPACRVGEGGWKAEKHEFLNLLRVHKHRHKSLTEEISRIASLARRAKGLEDLRSAKAAYLDACKRLGLPTGWAGEDLATSKK